MEWRAGTIKELSAVSVLNLGLSPFAPMDSALGRFLVMWL